MGILQNYNEGNMDALRSVKYSETGTQVPYVVKDIKNPPQNNDNTIGLQLNTRIDDTSRIAQMLVDKPGLKFIGNQALLNASEIASKTKAAADKKRNQKGGATAAGVFLAGAAEGLNATVAAAGQVLKIVGSTLAQVPVNGTGTHFVRGFNNDTYINKYYGLSSAPARALRGAPIIINNNGSEGYNVLFPKEKSDLADRQSTLTEKKSYDTQNWTDESTYTKTDTELNTKVAETGGTIISDNLGQEAYNQTAPSSYLKASGSNTTFSKTSENKYYEKGNDTTNDYLTQGSVNTITTKTRQSMASSGQEILPDNVSKAYKAPITSAIVASGSNTAFGNIESELSKKKANTPNTAILAQTGSVIPLQGITRNTTATKKDFGSTNQSVTGSVVGQEGYTIGLASTGSIKGSGTTISNILNAQNGSVIPLVKEEGAKETTAPISGSSTNQNITGNYTKPTNPGRIQNFRTGSFALDYSSPTINKETRVGLGNQGKPGRVRTNYSTDLKLSDKINAQDVLTNPATGSLAATKAEMRDFIKFRFEIITPEDNTFLFFRAFLTQFDDSYQSSWDTTKYLGRAENFYTYQGFERSINIGFNIAAATRQEMKPLYRKMAALASVTAPTYGGDGKFMRGTIARVTVGDYIYEVPGIIERVNYTWNTDYNWEIAFQNVDGTTDDDMQELPQTMDCSLTFKPIHSFIPQAVGKDRLLPYITNPTPNGSDKAIFIDQP